MHPLLSARQEQCLRLTAFRTDKEIAAHLGISEATVKKHVHEACQRLGVNRRKAALALMDPIVPDGVVTPALGEAVGYPKQPMAPLEAGDHASRSGGPNVEDSIGHGRTRDLVGRPPGPPARKGATNSGSVQAKRRVQETDRGGGHLGYRVPRGSAVFRIVLIVVLTLALAALVVTLVAMLGDMHEAVGKIDAANAAS